MAPHPPTARSAPRSGGPAEAVLYTDAKVHTLDPERPQARGLRVEGGRITHVFDGDVPQGLEGRRVSLGGAVVLPGLVDAHLHVRGIGAAARQLDLTGSASSQQVAEAVREAAARIPAGHWIRGRGWDQNEWPDTKWPTHSLLDEAAPEHPVMLGRVDGHAVWVNARAMELAGVDRDTADPSGGEIVRDAHGRPTGVFVDNAAALLERKLPDPGPQEVRAELRQSLAAFRRAGLTAVHDMGTTAAVLEQLRAMEREGELTVRVFAYLGGPWNEVEPLLSRPPDRDGLVRVVGVKLFADGALGSRGAAMLEPYADRPDTRGLLVTEPDVLEHRARAAHEAGYQVAIHAIGDRANRIALDVLESIGGGRASAPHHRIEHAQVVAPEALSRFAELGVVASMQPTHATSDMGWALDRLGEARLEGAYAWKTMLRKGIPLVLGSDAPVESEDPWLGIHAAVTRQDVGGRPEGGWRPSERLTVREALAGFTRGPAEVLRMDDLGIVRPGAEADLTVVDRDPFAVPHAQLARVRTLRTVVAGREVFVAEGGPGR